MDLHVSFLVDYIIVSSCTLAVNCTGSDITERRSLSRHPRALFTARSIYASAVLGIVVLFVRPSVSLSVTRVLWDKTKKDTADILIPHRGVITLVF